MSTEHLTRLKDGTLPARAWPGAYPLHYITADDGRLCPACANGQRGSEATRPTLDPACPDDRQWIVVAADVNWESPDLQCDHCGILLMPAYQGGAQ